MRHNRWLAAAAPGALLATLACSGPKPDAPKPAAAGTATLDRTVLPLAEPDYPHETELDARKATAAAAVRGEGPRRARRTC